MWRNGKTDAAFGKTGETFSLYSAFVPYRDVMKLRAPIAALALMLATTPALAQPGTGQDSLGAGWRQQQGEARQKVKEGANVPLDRVVETIRRRTPGRMLDAGLEADSGGRSVYRVRWAAQDGRRIDFLVDAASGSILSGG